MGIFLYSGRVFFTLRNKLQLAGGNKNLQTLGFAYYTKKRGGGHYF